MSGVYYVYIFDCSPFSDEHESHIVLRGTVMFRNPTGFLAADLYPNLPFFGVMSLAYLLLGMSTRDSLG
jgi:hypothetical protein